MNRFVWISISELLVRGMVFGLTSELLLRLISVFVEGYT